MGQSVELMLDIGRLCAKIERADAEDLVETAARLEAIPAADKARYPMMVNFAVDLRREAMRRPSVKVTVTAPIPVKQPVVIDLLSSRKAR